MSSVERRPGVDDEGDFLLDEADVVSPRPAPAPTVVAVPVKQIDAPPLKPPKRWAPAKETYGLYLQYFAVGIIYGGLPSTVYGFFLGYLNVESYVYSTAATVLVLPWSFKFLFGAINDCVPIFGYRRKPYMVIGWCLCTIALLVLAAMPLPDPYWCVNEAGDGYVKVDASASKHGAKQSAEPCNVAAATQGGEYALMMMLAAVGYCIADVAADGLTVTIARTEAAATRGSTQTTVYLVRTLGNVCAVMLVGLCMNSWKYNGSFEWGLSFSAVMGIFALPSAMMVPVSWLLVHEQKIIFFDAKLDPKVAASPKVTASPLHESGNDKGHEGRDCEAAPAASGEFVRYEKRRSFRQYAKSTWELLRSRAMLYVILYQFLTPLVGNISTTAGGEVKQHWAKVKTLQNACFSLVGLGLFAFGLYLVKTRYLAVSWRKMLLTTTVLLNLLDMPFVFLTVFGIVRNQYFYLGETVLVEIPAAAHFVVSTFVIVEMAEGGDEGLVYGLLTTTSNLGGPVASAISNQLFGLFKPDLSDATNYLEDAPSFRNVVAYSFALSYALSFLSLLTLPLLPDQKAEAQDRKKHWDKRDTYAYASIALIGTGLVYSVTINMLAMFPSTMCLKLAGGDGC